MSRPIDLRQDTESVTPRVPKKPRRGRPKWGSTFWARGIIPQRSDLCPFADACKSHYCDKPTGHNRCQVIEQYRNWAIRQYAQQDHIKDHHLPMVFNFVQAQMRDYSCSSPGAPLETTFSRSGWEIAFTIFLRPGSEEDLAGRRAQLTQTYPASFVPAVDKLKKRVADKCKDYGNLDLPFVLFVLDLDLGLDKDDFTQALFSSRGLWTSCIDHRNRRASAIVIVKRLSFWSLDKVQAAMIRNPVANMPYSGKLEELSCYQWSAGELVYKEGLALSAVLSRQQE